MKCIDSKTGKVLIEINADKERARRLVTITEGALVAILAFERPMGELEWEIPESLYGKFERALGWLPEEGRHERLFGIKANWVGGNEA